MSPIESRLRTLALLSLDESYQAAQKGPIDKSASLRLTLAVLSTFLPERDSLDQFWKEVTNPPMNDTHSAAYGRRQSLGNAYRRIYVLLGMEAPD
jgi:hypothetical protein